MSGLIVKRRPLIEVQLLQARSLGEEISHG